MIGFAGNALSYTAGLSKAEFVADSRTYDATLRNLELIGEAARNIPEEVRSAHPEIPRPNPDGDLERIALTG